MGILNIFRRKYSVNDFSLRLISCSIDSANQIRKFSEKYTIQDGGSGLDNEKWISIYFEYLYLWLHLADRVAFSLLDTKKRAEFMDSLVGNTISTAVDWVCKKWTNDLRGKIKNEAFSNYNSFQMEFTNYKKMFAEKDEGTKDTLFWEFGKNVAEKSGNFMDIAYVGFSMEVATIILKDLDLKKWIEKSA